MRSYARVPVSSFLDQRIQDVVKRHGPAALGVAGFLRINPFANMLGLYYVPITMIAASVCGQDAPSRRKKSESLVSAIIASLEQSEWCVYDSASSFVWICDMAAEEVGDGCKSLTAARRLFAEMPTTRLTPLFAERYNQRFCLTGRDNSLSAQLRLKASSDQQQQGSLPIDPTVSVSEAESEEFANAWNAYPQRDGPNPRPAAWREWRDRVAEGHTEAELESAARQYAEYAIRQKTIGTRYVMQTHRFFGKDKPFVGPFDAPRESTANQDYTKGVDANGAF